MAALVMVITVLVLCVDWSSAPPAALPADPKPASSASSNADVGDVHVRLGRAFHPEESESSGPVGGGPPAPSGPIGGGSPAPSAGFTVPSGPIGAGTPVPVISDGFTVPSMPIGGGTPVPVTSGKDDFGPSPYFHGPQGHPPHPPTLHDELNPPPPPCPDMETICDPDSRYRTFSGRYNNLQHPDHGTPGTTFRTILPQTYDLPAVFRTRSVRGHLLPNPRMLSLLFRHTPEGDKVPVNALFLQLGQFIDHDIAITTTATNTDRSQPACRPCSSWHNPRCVPIPIPVNDPYMPAFMQGTGQPRCLPLTRTVAHLVTDARGRSTLHQVNFNTAFIDMSPIYGNEACTAHKLRQHRDGKLLSGEHRLLTRRPAKEFLACNSDDGWCFFSGDSRANENLGQPVIHVLLHRAHNKLAEDLQMMNPHWDDERLFQEARRINIARLQNIIYRDYLPTLLGYHTAAKMQFMPNNEGYFLGYEPTISPAIYTDFTTAAFRMGHSQVPAYIALFDHHYNSFYHIPLHYTFFNTTLLAQAGAFEPLLRGLLGVSLNPVDLHFVEELGNKLFHRKGNPLSGHDLLAINIARGRDHGLAPYVQYLAACSIKEVSSFDDLKSLIPDETINVFSRAYADVRDVDVYVGGLAEIPLADSLVGPTFSCIIARQFTSLKVTDRFWFESPGAAFTHAQLQSIRQTTLEQILCDCMDHPDPLVPTKALHIPDPQSNPLKRCRDIPRINLETWRELSDRPPTTCFYLGHNYQVGDLVPISPCRVCVCQSDGELRCQCNLSGCTQAPQDHECRRICGNSPPHLRPPYPQ